MKVRVTQSDIARVAGVHNTTVSLALRNSQLIPPATRERIQSIAQNLGYAPDPALRALAAYRNSRRERREVQTLAYITDGETKWSWKHQPAHEKHYLGAQCRAAELGYRLEHLWFGEAGMSHRRLDRMLLHRGIRGVLLASQRTTCEELAAIDWSRLSAVKIGCFPSLPALNQVATDPVSVMRLALQRIFAEGGVRPGLILPRHWDELADRAWSAAFHAEIHRRFAKSSVPVLYLPDSSAKASLAHWYQQYRPDVIVGLTPAVLSQIRDCGLRVPADVAYVDLFLQDMGCAIAGVQDNSERIGALSVEMLVNQLEQNIFGLPAVPTVTSIRGVWRDGASLPVRAPVAASLNSPDLIGRNLVA